jgi:hypothetical protein
MGRTFCPDGVRFAEVYPSALGIHIASLTCTDAAGWAFSVWLNLDSDLNNQVVWMSDPDAFEDYFELFNGSPGDRRYNCEVYDVGGTHFADATSDVVTAGDQDHFLVSGNVVTGQIAVYRNRVNVTSNYVGTSGGTTTRFNGKPFWVSNDPSSDPYTGTMSEFWFANESLLEMDGTISDATLDKFIKDGCPVDLGANGSTPTGTQPPIYFSRAHGAPASTFGTNLGSGGTFTTDVTATAVDNICACLGPDAQPYHPMVALIPARVGSGGEGL